MIKILIFILILVHQIVYFQHSFSKEELQSDAQILFQALNDLHPGLYRHSDTATIEKAYNVLQNDFSTEKDAEAVFLNFPAFASKIRCGHTYVNPFNQKNKIIPSVIEQKVLLPFTFTIIDKQIVVNKPLIDNINKNTIITHLNGIKVENIIDSLTFYVKTDSNRTTKKIKDLEVHLISKYEYFDYYFPMIYDFTDSIKIKTNNGDTETIQLLTKEERASSFTHYYPNINTSNYDDLWSQEVKDKHAYLRLGTFVTWRLSFDWKDYLEEFFNEIESKGIEHLIIDIRGNEGGLTDVTEYLVEKLTKTDGQNVFRKPHLAYRKVDDKLKPHLSTWSKWFYNTSTWTKKLNDQYRTVKFSGNKAKKIKKNKNAFLGSTYLLVDGSNSSATFILAEVYKKNNYAILVERKRA